MMHPGWLHAHSCCVESSKFSQMDPTMPDKCRCHWFFFSFFLEWFDFMVLITYPAASAACLLFQSIFPVVQSWPPQKLSTFRRRMDTFSGTFHNWCARSHPLHLSPLFAVTQPALSVCYSSAAQIFPLLYFSFFFFCKTRSNAPKLIEMLPSLPHLYGRAHKNGLAWSYFQSQDAQEIEQLFTLVRPSGSIPPLGVMEWGQRLGD